MEWMSIKPDTSDGHGSFDVTLFELCKVLAREFCFFTKPRANSFEERFLLRRTKIGTNFSLCILFHVTKIVQKRITKVFVQKPYLDGICPPIIWFHEMDIQTEDYVWYTRLNDVTWLWRNY